MKLKVYEESQRLLKGTPYILFSYKESLWYEVYKIDSMQLDNAYMFHSLG